MIISSPSNEQIKNIINLKQKPKYRNERGHFIVEGIKMFMEIPEDGVVKVYVSESFYSSNSALFDGTKKVQLVTDAIFTKISDTVTPQGILCIAKQKVYRLEDFIFDGEVKKRFLVLEKIQDPGNLGTIIRTSEGAGISAVIAEKGTVDRYNPKVIRSTMGSIYRVPFIIAEDLGQTIDILKKSGIKIFAAHLQGREHYDQINYGDKAAILIGNESNGLSEEIAGKADMLVKIPMCGQVESLNAAVAASIFMYAAR